MAAKRATLKDVAERSGYALRTVKNVVAGKSSVGGPVREAVYRAMEELNYKQNSLASTLAKNQAFQIAVILPEIVSAYQEKLKNGIQRCAESYEDYGLETEIHYTKPTVQAQIRLLEEFYEREDVDGILLQPVCESGLESQVDLLVYGNKPVITLGTDLTQSKRSCFVGSDQFRSGRIAAQLMANYIGRTGEVLITYREGSRLRLDGFQAALTDRYPDMTVQTFCLSDDGEENRRILSEMIQNGTVQGIFDGDDYLLELGYLLQEMNRSDLVLMGSNSNAETMELLKNGYVDVVISQEPESTGYTATDTLFRYLSRSETIPKRVYTPLSIVTSECL